MCRDTLQPGTAIRRSAPCDTAQWRYDTRDNVRSWPWCWVCRDIGCDTAGQACDTAMKRPATPTTKPVLGLRHGALRATTRRSASAAWAQCAWPRRTVRAARVCWVCLCAPNPVLDSVHCFESLFRPLFMNTVYEHCSQDFSKKIKNQINKIK